MQLQSVAEPCPGNGRHSSKADIQAAEAPWNSLHVGWRTAQSGANGSIGESLHPGGKSRQMRRIPTGANSHHRSKRRSTRPR